MRFLKWLYRLPGRINRSFGPTAAAASVESGGTYGGAGTDVTAVSMVAEEIKKSTGSNDDQAPQS